MKEFGWKHAVFISLLSLVLIFWLVPSTGSTGVNDRPFTIGQVALVVQISGDPGPMAGVVSVDGLDSSTEVVEYRDNESILLGKRPGQTRYGNVVIRRLVTKGMSGDLWQWRKGVATGRTERRTVQISYLSDDGNEIVKYRLDRAWPSSIKVKLESNGVLYEHVEFAFEKIEVVTGKTSIRI